MDKQPAKYPDRQPPQWAANFLAWYCDPDLLDEVLGDLLEVFQIRVVKLGHRKARLLFIKEVLLFFKPSTINRSRFNPVEAIN